MLTDFEKKRIEYFIKACEKSEFVQLSKGDLKIFNEIKNINIKQEEQLKIELAQYQIKIDN